VLKAKADGVALAFARLLERLDLEASR